MPSASLEYQFLDSSGARVEQVKTKDAVDIEPIADGEDTIDTDASTSITTVGELNAEVQRLVDDEGITKREAYERLQYAPSTLQQYSSTKPDEHPLGWEDPDGDIAEEEPTRDDGKWEHAYSIGRDGRNNRADSRSDASARAREHSFRSSKTCYVLRARAEDDRWTELGAWRNGRRVR